MEERLQKILARAGFSSRRGAEQLMAEGRVTVDGEVVRELGSKADVEKDDVRVDGVRVKAPKGPVYLVLNKPKGIVSTRKDPEGRPTVMDLVPPVPGLFPVGRLDVTTEGLLILTNDGVFAERVSHPRYEVPRVYHAKVHGVPDENALARLRQGVTVDGDVLSVDRARVLESDNNAWLELTLHEGRQHEVKRMLDAVGHPVSKLRRVAFGPVTTRGLEPGQCRELSPEEVAGLVRGEGQPRLPGRGPRRPKPFRARAYQGGRRGHERQRPPFGGSRERGQERGSGTGEGRVGAGPRRSGSRPPLRRSGADESDRSERSGFRGEHGFGRSQGSDRAEGPRRDQGFGRGKGSDRRQGFGRGQGSSRSEDSGRNEGYGRDHGSGREQASSRGQGRGRGEDFAGSRSFGTGHGSGRGQSGAARGRDARAARNSEAGQQRPGSRSERAGIGGGRTQRERGQAAGRKGRGGGRGGRR